MAQLASYVRVSVFVETGLADSVLRGTKMETKSVLVTYGENRRIFNLPVSAERSYLLERCRTEFRDFIPDSSSILTLQTKNESWGGIFIDYTLSSIEDRAVFV